MVPVEQRPYLSYMGRQETIVIRNADPDARLPVCETQFSFTSCVTLVKFLNCSVIQFSPHLNGNSSSTDHTGLTKVNTCKNESSAWQTQKIAQLWESN